VDQPGWSLMQIPLGSQWVPVGQQMPWQGCWLQAQLPSVAQCVPLAQQTPLQGGWPLPQGAPHRPLLPQLRLQHCTSAVHPTPSSLHAHRLSRQTAVQHSPLTVQAAPGLAQMQVLPEHSPAQQNSPPRQGSLTSQHEQLPGLMLWQWKEQSPPQAVTPLGQRRHRCLLRLQLPEAHWAFFLQRPPGGRRHLSP
jgi:hypothetical protein